MGASDDALSQRRIDLLQPASWAEWVEDLGGIGLHRRHATTMGWALRGGLGGQIALRFDGVPLLGALQDLDPSRQLLTIDPRIIGGLRLQRGPSSYRWGNHAMTGAILLRSIALPKPQGKAWLRFSGRARGSYQSADQAPAGHLTLGLSGSGGGVLLAGGGGVHDALKTGGETGSVHQSDFNRAHAMGSFQWRWHHTTLKALYLFGQADQLKYTALFFPQSDVSSYRERRHLAYLSLEQGVGRGRMALQVAYQFLDTYEFTQDFALGTRSLQASREIALPRHMLSARLRGEHPIGRQVQIEYQIEWIWEQMVQEVLSQWGRQQLLPSPYPRRGERHSLAAAVGVRWRPVRDPVRFELAAGGRFHPHWDRLFPPQGDLAQDGFTAWHLPWAARLDATLADPLERWSLALSYHTGYRVPSWQAQAGAGPQGQVLWRPNADLRPEMSHSVELKFATQWWQRIHVAVRGFVQLWDQFIGLREVIPSGGQNPYPTLQHTNHPALMPFVGLEGLAWVRIWRGWSAKASLAWIHLFDGPLQTTPQAIWPTTPPLSGQFATRYQFGRWGGIEAMLRVVAGQSTRLAPLVLQLLRNQKNPTYVPWTTVTIRANLRITRHLHIVANLENLSHQAYLRFGSLIYAPGINYRFQLVGQW